MNRDSLGDRMKRYEHVWSATLPRRLPVIVRVDGRAFHTYLAKAEKPFDMEFVEQMGLVARSMCQAISGSVFAYHQSDEISILVCDYPGVNTEPWFGGNVQKIVSVAASTATTNLAWHRRDRPMFDARVFVLPDAVETVNYFLWRQKDAMRNAVSMAAQAVFPHKALQGVNVPGMKDMLAAEGINFDDYPAEVRFGQQVRHVTWSPREADVSADEQGRTVLSWHERHYWEIEAAWEYAATPENWMAKTVPPTATFPPEPLPGWVTSG